MNDFNKFKIVGINDIGVVERAKHDKIYKQGCTLIALSATKGEVEYLNEERKIDTRYAVVIPNEENNSKYIYLSILQAFPEFIYEWKTGINLQFDKLQYLRFHLHDRVTQDEIVDKLDTVNRKEKDTRQKIRLWKELKKSFLEELFC